MEHQPHVGVSSSPAWAQFHRLAHQLEHYWDGLLNGRSGIRRITQFDPS